MWTVGHSVGIMTSTQENYTGNRVRQLRKARGWDQKELAGRAGISRTTLIALENGKTETPRLATLEQLSAAFKVSVRDLCDSAIAVRQLPTVEFVAKELAGLPTDEDSEAARHFDQLTNPVVKQVAAESPTLFSGWDEADWNELYSTFGTGGQLTEFGVRQTAAKINQRREILRKLCIVLETEYSDLAEEMIELLYRRTQPTDNLDNTPELRRLLSER